MTDRQRQVIAHRPSPSRLRSSADRTEARGLSRPSAERWSEYGPSMAAAADRLSYPRYSERVRLALAWVAGLLAFFAVFGTLQDAESFRARSLLYIAVGYAFWKLYLRIGERAPASGVLSLETSSKKSCDRLSPVALFHRFARPSLNQNDLTEAGVNTSPALSPFLGEFPRLALTSGEPKRAPRALLAARRRRACGASS